MAEAFHVAAFHAVRLPLYAVRAIRALIRKEPQAPPVAEPSWGSGVRHRG